MEDHQKYMAALQERAQALDTSRFLREQEEREQDKQESLISEITDPIGIETTKEAAQRLIPLAARKIAGKAAGDIAQQTVDNGVSGGINELGRQITSRVTGASGSGATGPGASSGSGPGTSEPPPGSSVQSSAPASGQRGVPSNLEDMPPPRQEEGVDYGGGVGQPEPRPLQRAATVAEEEAPEEDLSEALTGSIAGDENPIGLAVTAALGIATFFAGLFGSRKATPALQPVVNPSTQFGV